MSVNTQSFVWTALVLIIWRLYWNRRKVKATPGPFLASCTDLWQLSIRLTGSLPRTLQSLHQQYGPVVRYAPNAVSIADPSAIGTIYGTNPIFTKADSYKVMIGIANGKEIPSVISVMNEARHSALKKPIASSFTTNALLDYEHYMDETTDEFIEVISKMPTLDMARWFQYYTMDVLSRIAFSETLGFTKNGHDIGGTIESVVDRFDHWGWWGPLPTLERIIFKNPLILKLLKSTTPLTRLATKKLHVRKTTTMPPMQRDLLQKYIEASEKHPEAIDTEAILGLCMSTIAAGADTTAVTLCAIIYYLLKNPETLAKLEKELGDGVADGSVSNPPRFAETSKLKYLDAVIKESMRMYPIIMFPLERVVVAGGVELAGTFFPEGTVVGCDATVIHKNRDVYGQDADVFNPERWLLADESKRRAMERANLGFGAGKRICIGQHIAMLEMKKLIPNLVMKFKMSLVDPDQEIKTKSSSIAYTDPIFVRFEERTA